MIFRRPYADVVRRQLELFAREHAELLAEIEAALRAYDTAARDEATERYADYDDLLDTAREALGGLRYAYASTLDEDRAEQYEETFNRAAAKRFPRISDGLPDL